jgi:1,4-dihydroxy-2-naphthoate octaprenyltransferase
LGNLATIIRANFLPLAVVIVFAGLAAAFYAHHTLKPVDGLLALIGALLTHASVNTFNNYFDYRSRIDAKTMKTPFSGGVSILVDGAMKPSRALWTAIAALAGAGLVGVYFLVRFYTVLFPIILAGFVLIVFYSPILSKIHGISELAAGSGFGLIGLGTYVTQTGSVEGPGLAVFVPVTILVGLLLFLNEFPDADVDKEAGRHHLVVLLGRKNARWLYLGGLVATYLSIVIAVIASVAPVAILLSLVTIPIAYKATRITLINYEQIPNLIPAMGLNVILILSTIGLLGAGFTLGSFI